MRLNFRFSFKSTWWLRQWRIRLQCRRPGFSPWVGKIPWSRAWQPTPVFLPEESPWTEEAGGLQSMGSQRVGHAWATKHSREPCMMCEQQGGIRHVLYDWSSTGAEDNQDRIKSGVIVNAGIQLWMDKDPDRKSGRVTGKSIQSNWFLISWVSTGCNWGIQLCWRARDCKQSCSFSSKWLYLGSLHPYHKNCASLSYREKIAWAGVNSMLLSLILPF